MEPASPINKRITRFTHKLGAPPVWMKLKNHIGIAITKPFPAHPCLKAPNGDVKTAAPAKVRQLKPSGFIVLPFVRHLKGRFLKEGSGTKIKIAPRAQLKTHCRNKTTPKQLLFSTEPQDEGIKRSIVKKQHQYILHEKVK